MEPPPEAVGVGSSVRLRFIHGSGNPARSNTRDEDVWHLSPADPVGRALLGRRVGDMVTLFEGKRMVAVEILGVEPRR
jgi:transcription elongation GreA/GreB family factor